MGSVVLGLEGDINWIGNDSKRGFNNYVGPAISTNITNYSLDGNPQSNMLGSIRGRLGWSFDRAMLYVTGGAAFRNSGSDEVIYAYNSVTGANVAAYTVNSGRNNVGWSLGGGLEWAFTNNVSLKLEYLHSQFNTGDGVYLTTANNYTAYAFRGDNNRDSVDIARLGINYRFGGPVSAPVLARY